MEDNESYPPPAFAFSVAVSSGSQHGAVDAAFNEISGLDPKVEIEEVIEGGQNSFVHQLPGVTEHSNLVLKRGYVTASTPLAAWAEQSVGSTLGTPTVTKVLTVSLMGPTGQPMVTWTFQDAWPVKWEVGHFDAAKNDFLTETLEVSYTTVVRTITPEPGAGSH